MLDVKFIRENLELVEKSAREKGYKVNIREVVSLDDERKVMLSEIESLRQKRNEIAATMKSGKPDDALIEKGKKIKTELAEKEKALAKVEDDLTALLKTVPNIIFDDGTSIYLKNIVNLYIKNIILVV